MTNGVRRTKIVCTLGPASSTQESVEALVAAGMDGARLNFSHGTHEEHAARAELVRGAQETARRPLAVIADLQGPKLRIGDLAEPISLREGDDVTVAGDDGTRDGYLPITPPVITEVLRAGHDVLIDDGLVRLRVEAVEQGRARCAVVVG